MVTIEVAHPAVLHKQQQQQQHEHDEMNSITWIGYLDLGTNY
jgi:hypothetical protein